MKTREDTGGQREIGETERRDMQEMEIEGQEDRVESERGEIEAQEERVEIESERGEIEGQEDFEELGLMETDKQREQAEEMGKKEIEAKKKVVAANR